MSRAGLSERARDVLNSLIRLYVATGEPVGSETLAGSLKRPLSPASVRGVMSDLEKLGYLDHTHTSAGRIPTDDGYRVFVDNLETPSLLPKKQAAVIDSMLRDQESPSHLLEGASHVLSKLSHQVGFVIASDLSRASFRRVDLVRLGPQRILVVMVSLSGIVTNKVIEVEEDMGQDVLQACSNYLNAEFQGWTLAQIRQRLLELMGEEKALYDSLLRAVISVGRAAFGAGAGEGSVYLDGTGNILDVAAPDDLGRLRGLFRTFEEKGRLVKILTACISGSGLRVVIGHENPDPGLSQMALVSCSVEEEGGVGVGVMGSTRMEYARVMALVDHVARHIRQALMESR